MCSCHVVYVHLFAAFALPRTRSRSVACHVSKQPPNLSIHILFLTLSRASQVAEDRQNEFASHAWGGRTHSMKKSTGQPPACLSCPSPTQSRSTCLRRAGVKYPLPGWSGRAPTHSRATCLGRAGVRYLLPGWSGRALPTLSVRIPLPQTRRGQESPSRSGV